MFAKMASGLSANRFLAARRFTQAAIMFLFIAGNLFGWNILKGNLSAARLFGFVPLSDPFALLQVASTRNLVSAEALAGALIVVLFYSLIAGRAFCSWVCPLNLVTDSANRLRRFLKFEEAGKVWWIDRKVRYWALGLSLVISAFLGVAAFEWVSPVSMFHRGVIFGMGFGWAAVLTVFLFDLFAVNNGFCGHLCPLGAFYSLVGRFSLVRVAHDKEKCTLCMKCAEVCSEKQVLHMLGKQSGPVLSGECTNCGRCVDVCDDRAMGFSNRPLPIKKLFD